MVPILFLQKKQGAALKTKKKKGHDLSKVNDHPAFHFSVPTVEVSFHYNYSFGVLAFPTEPQRSRNDYVLSKIVLFAFWRQNPSMIFRTKIGQKSVNLVNKLIF